MFFTFKEANSMTVSRQGILKSPSKLDTSTINNRTMTHNAEPNWFKNAIGKKDIDEELMLAEEIHLTKQKELKSKVDQLLNENVVKNIKYNDFHKILNDDQLMEKIA